MFIESVVNTHVRLWNWAKEARYVSTDHAITISAAYLGYRFFKKAWEIRGEEVKLKGELADLTTRLKSLNQQDAEDNFQLLQLYQNTKILLSSAEMNRVNWAFCAVTAGAIAIGNFYHSWMGRVS